LPLPKKKPTKHERQNDFDFALWAEKHSASDKSSYGNQEMWWEEPRKARGRRVCEALKDTGRVIARRGKRR